MNRTADNFPAPGVRWFCPWWRRRGPRCSWTPARMTTISSPVRRLSTHLSASARAFSKRDGVSSVAFMDAEPSRDDDAPFATVWPGPDVGPRQRQHREREQKDLQIEQPVLAEFLKRRAGLRVRGNFLPKERAGNQLHHALALQQQNTITTGMRMAAKAKASGARKLIPRPPLCEVASASKSCKSMFDGAMKKFMSNCAWSNTRAGAGRNSARSADRPSSGICRT